MVEFPSIADAVRWADNFLSRPSCKIQTGEIMKKAVQQPTSLWNREDAENAAITITTTLANVSFPHGAAYRVIHGQGQRHRLDVADELAHAAWNGPEGGKTIARMRDIALLVLERVKRRERSGRGLGLGLIAKELNISLRTLHRNYRDDIAKMESLLGEWSSITEHEIGPKLRDSKII